MPLLAWTEWCYSMGSGREVDASAASVIKRSLGSDTKAPFFAEEDTGSVIKTGKHLRQALQISPKMYVTKNDVMKAM